jgi:hypothetical protein
MTGSGSKNMTLHFKKYLKNKKEIKNPASSVPMKPVKDSKPIKEPQTSPDSQPADDPQSATDTTKVDSVRVLQFAGGILGLILVVGFILQLFR